MASKLSSILVKQGLLPIKKLDHAFQIQVLHGGTLDTSLFEMDMFKERDLIPHMVTAAGIPSINLRNINIENPTILKKTFPPRLAQRHKIVPVIKNKEKVGVLVTVDFDKTKLEEMGFMLGITIYPRVVPEFRLWQIATKIYGFPLDLRFEILQKKMGDTITYQNNYIKDWSFDVLLPADTIQEESNNQNEIKFQEDLNDKTPIPDFEYVENQVSSDVLLPVIQNKPINSPDFEDNDIFEAQTKPGFKFVKSPDFDNELNKQVSGQIDIGKSESTSTSVESSVSEDVSSQEQEDFSNLKTIDYIHPENTLENQTENTSLQEQNTVESTSTSVESSVSEDVSSQKQEDFSDLETVDYIHPENTLAQNDSEDQTVPLSQVELSEILKDDTTFSFPENTNNNISETAHSNNDSTSISSNKTMDISDFESMALQIAQSDSKDDILISFLRYASTFCDISFIFTITKNAAKARFAIINNQLFQDTIRNYFISLEFPSFLEQSSKNIPYYGEFSTTEENIFITNYLNIETPSHIICIPITIGTKTVAIFFGTRSQQFESPKIFGDVVSAAALTSQAFLRIIKQKKQTVQTVKKLRQPAILLNNNENPAIKQIIPDITAKMSTQNDSSFEEIIALLDKLEHISHQQGSLDILAAKELKKHKEKTLEVLTFYFPGMITVNTNNINLLPQPSKTGPLMEFIIDWGLPTVPTLMNLFDSENSNARFFSVYAFSEIRLPQVLPRIADKLIDQDESIRKIAAKVILSYEGHDEFNVILQKLITYLTIDTENLIYYIDALSLIPSKPAIPHLINLLKNQNTPKHIKHTTLKALQNITHKSFDSDPSKWETWWELNKTRHRILWLIDALKDESEQIRIRAIGELRRIVGTDMFYNPISDVNSRANSIKHWVSWWDRQGKRIYTD